MNKHQSCILCGSTKLTPMTRYYTKHGLVKCNVCSFVFMERIPTIEQLKTHYGKYPYSFEGGSVSPLTIQSYESLLDEFEPYRKNNKLLDTGCGLGLFLIQAKKRGWEVYGTEYAEGTVAICESKGITMKTGKLDESTFGDTKFDVITSFEVIEHLNYPNSEMKAIHSLLRTGGLFYCTTPNFNSLNRLYLKENYDVIDYPEHLAYFTPKTLGMLAEKHDFKVKKIITSGVSVSRINSSQSDKINSKVPQGLSDEKLRENIASKWYLKVAKNWINAMLNITGTGMALKGYFVKKEA